MTINKIYDGSTLTVKCEGELDSMSSQNLESVVRTDLDDVECLIFDFEKLEYISSAGLRVLLSAQKKMNVQGKMVIKNVCNDIKEIFDITGFSDIFTFA